MKKKFNLLNELYDLNDNLIECAKCHKEEFKQSAHKVTFLWSKHLKVTEYRCNRCFQ
jgi:hypothetical protein